MYDPAGVVPIVHVAHPTIEGEHITINRSAYDPELHGPEIAPCTPAPAPAPAPAPDEKAGPELAKQLVQQQAAKSRANKGAV